MLKVKYHADTRKQNLNDRFPHQLSAHDYSKIHQDYFLQFKEVPKRY